MASLTFFFFRLNIELRIALLENGIETKENVPFTSSPWKNQEFPIIVNDERNCSDI